MGVQFRKDHSHADRHAMLRVVIPAAEKPIHLVIGRNPIFWRTCAMHWDTELGRMQPCRTKGCTYCPKATREITYVPVLLAAGASPAGRFAPRIVPVTDGWFEILDSDHSTNVYRVVRQAKSEACRWTIATTLSAYRLTPYEGQEIEPSLLRMWGLKNED